MSNWHIFDLKISSTSPLHLGNESDIGNFLQTRNAIPGANLRGAVADRAMQACTHPEQKMDHANCSDRERCVFWRLFGEQEPLFGYAYPGKSGPAFPFPLTARTCKLYPGYEGSDQEERHGVYDLLVDHFVYALLSDPHYPLRETLQPGLSKQWARLNSPPQDICPKCKETLVQAEGHYAQPENQPPGYAGSLSVRRATHVGINRARAVAEDSILFTLETIEPAAEALYFHARVVVAQDRADMLRDYLKGKYSVGRGRSWGLGQVELSISREQARSASIQHRLDRFQNIVRKVLLSYQSQDNRIQADSPGTFFYLTLCSPAILESNGCVQTRLRPDIIGLSEAHLLQAWARTETITGWHSAAGFPRRTHLGIQSGSVFLYWAPPSLPTTRLVEQLEKLEVEGVGEQRPRGYGQVLACAPFHWYNQLGDTRVKRS